MPGPRFENPSFCLPGGNSDEYVKNFDAVFGRVEVCKCGAKFRTKGAKLCASCLKDGSS